MRTRSGSLYAVVMPRVMLNFQHYRDGWAVHFIEADCWQPYRLCAMFGVSAQAFGQRSEVTIGAQAWAYDRVYPLLDGLFQDTASTGIKGLTLDPNASNGTQVDALVQSLQIQAGYNQLSGVQNSVAAQMAVANLGYQSTITQQQESVLQQQIASQQQLTQAQQNLTLVTQNGTAAQIATATQAVTLAQSLVTGSAAEAALIKGPTSPFQPTPASGTIATSIPASMPSTVIPAAVSGAVSRVVDHHFQRLNNSIIKWISSGQDWHE